MSVCLRGWKRFECGDNGRAGCNETNKFSPAGADGDAQWTQQKARWSRYTRRIDTWNSGNRRRRRRLVDAAAAAMAPTVVMKQISLFSSSSSSILREFPFNRIGEERKSIEGDEGSAVMQNRCGRPLPRRIALNWNASPRLFLDSRRKLVALEDYTIHWSRRLWS